MGFIEPPLELFSLERKAAWLPGGLSVFIKDSRVSDSIVNAGRDGSRVSPLLQQPGEMHCSGLERADKNYDLAQMIRSSPGSQSHSCAGCSC